MKEEIEPKPFLKWQGPDGQDKIFTLGQEEVILGRRSDADIVLSDPYVSRHHAKLVKSGDPYSLVDLGSTHGSQVNEERISQKLLYPGDKISLGQRVEMIFGQELADGTSLEETVEDPIKKSLMDLTMVLPQAYSGYSDMEKLSFLLDFQYNLGQQFSAKVTFEHILASALKISGAERGFILLAENDAQSFRYELGMSGAGKTMQESEFVQASQTVVRQVAGSGEPVFMTEGIDGDLAHQDSIVAMNLLALACLPLKWIAADSDTDEVHGILYLDSTKMMHALSGLDQKILSKLALEAGNVFEKVQMLETLEERKLLEQDLALAQETQQSLLPKEVPELKHLKVIAYSQPTHHVGGDFYDFLGLSTDELVGVLADVSGKGISAALLSSLLQGALDMEIRSGMELADALDRLLCERSQANRFVTLFLVQLGNDGDGIYISARHNPAFLYRAETGDVEQLESEHMILGAFGFATYASSPLHLDPNDILVIYTDGLTDAENPAGDMFEEDRLVQLIKEVGNSGAEALEMRILESIEEFTQGMAQTDDITLMLLQRI